MAENYKTYTNGKFINVLHDDLGGKTEETVDNVVSKTEDGACVTLRFANGDAGDCTGFRNFFNRRRSVEK
jgi:hypothetical protein